jgi:hypothetical protein
LDWSLLQNWALGGPIVCFIALMCVPALRNTAVNPSDRAYWCDLLRHDRPAERYRSVMRKGLDWLDSRLSSREAQQGPAQRAWSFGLLNITMALAFAYPILAITIQWLCGHAIDFGGQEVIAASPPQARIFTAVWLGSSLFFYLFAGASKSRWRWTLVILATGILALGSIFADRFAVPRNVAGAVAGTVALAVTGTVASAFAVAGTVAVAGAEVRSSRPMAWRLLDCGVLVALLIVAIKMPDDFGAGQLSRVVFVMLTFCLLPLVNAVFDFASVGLTRYLLRLGLEQKRAAWRAVLYGLGGIAIFFALGCTLIRLCHLCCPGRWGAACGFDTAFYRYAQGARRLYLVDDKAVFHAPTHPIASLCRGAHPRAAIPCRGAQFCGRSFGARRAERASGPPLWHMYLRHDHHRALVSDLDLYLRHHP